MSKPDELFKLMDGMRLYAEAVGGLRKQLIEEHGFAPDIADSIVLQAIRANGQNQEEENE